MKMLAMLMILWLSVGVAYACTTRTILIDGKIVICTTCGNQTTCF